MGMHSYVIGIKPVDEKYIAMKAVYESCIAAGIEIPDIVDSYFLGDKPDNSGIIVDDLPKSSHKEWCDGISSQGIEVDLRELPEDIKIIRFINSY